MKLSLERVEHLKKGLEEVISKVENNPKEVYNMRHFYSCILGVNYNVNDTNQGWKLKMLFGLDDANLYANRYDLNKTRLESLVLKLFTTDVLGGERSFITKEEWLKEANEVLKELNKAITKRSKQNFN